MEENDSLLSGKRPKQALTETQRNLSLFIIELKAPSFFQLKEAYRAKGRFPRRNEIQEYQNKQEEMINPVRSDQKTH